MRVSVDTDVVVLVIATVSQLNIKEVWKVFGAQRHFRFLAIHILTKRLGASR